MENSSFWPDSLEKSQELYESMRNRAKRTLIQGQPHLQDVLDTALQEAFLVYSRHLKEKTILKPRAYLWALISRQFLDYRKRRKAPVDSFRYCQMNVWVRDRFNNGEELFSSLTEPYLLDWYRNLSPQNRQLIDLRIKGYNYAEIAELTKLSNGGARNKFHQLIRHAKQIVKRA